MATQMAQEIAEQPETTRRTLAALTPLSGDLRALMEGRSRVLLVARGSSDNAAVYGRYLLEAYAGINAGLASPSIATHYRTRLDLSDALVVAVSQSGATAEIVETMSWAADCGARTVAVTNDADSPLATGADLALVTQAGPELAVPATKSYLGQLVAMAVLARALHPAPWGDELELVADQIEALIAAQDEVDAAVGVLHDSAHMIVSGRGLCMGTALEAALKLEETCLKPVRGYSYADLRHGPISVVTEGVAAVLVAAKDGPLVAPMAELAADLTRRGATTAGIGGDPAFAAACAVHVAGPDLSEPVAPLGLIVPVQLVVERLARALGLDPDNPRGLAKVTQTDSD